MPSGRSKAGSGLPPRGDRRLKERVFQEKSDYAAEWSTYGHAGNHRATCRCEEIAERIPCEGREHRLTERSLARG